ncbi:Putative uncharacterized protein TTHA1760 [hydrothermal vent metagenome]|uniref:Quinol:cytochrome C oxidoreductase n=1 Tax=hydrothermal vent metagenome TaxID=652676 RepID=A0A3B1DI75_9ZZZZ
MSQISAEAYQKILAGVTSDPRMAEDNVSAPAAVTAKLSKVLLGLGAAGLLVTLIAGFAVDAKHAMASYLVAVGAVFAMTIGALILVMAFHLVNAGWCATVRRQFENLMSLAPVALVMLLPLIILELLFTKGALWEWLIPGIAEADPLIAGKTPYLNPAFFSLRFVLYLAILGFLTVRLRGYSLEQDRTGDRFLSARARFMSAWGTPLAAITIAFAGFDYFMSLQPHFFSTMWGVYIFAGGACACMGVIVITFALLRSAGRLEGLVTDEHFHDMGKLLFAFTCFWAYIGFSQYFLIWYANIPEETFWLLERTTGAWKGTSIFLAVGHFIVPFFFLLPRAIKRNPKLISIGAAWLIVMHVVDYVWIVRPILHHGDHAPTPMTWWIDIAAIVGVFGVFFGLYVARVGAGPLIPLKDPKLPESLAHKNYV